MAAGKKTGGRKAGTLNKATVELQIRAKQGVAAALNEGLMPLDVMRARMRDEPLSNGRYVTDEQLQAAIAAAPYIHPKLAMTATKDLTALGSGPAELALDYSLLSVEDLAGLKRMIEKARPRREEPAMVDGEPDAEN